MFSTIFPASSPEGAHIEFFSIPHEKGPGARKILVSVEDIHSGAVDSLIKSANNRRHHLYYRNSLRYPNGAWMGSWCLWADIDMDDMSMASNILHKIEIFKPEPTWIYWSGRRGYHLVWLLDRFCTDPKKIQTKLKGLVEHLGADPAVGNIMKGLRVPGSYNWKADNAGDGDTGMVKLIGPPRLIAAMNEPEQV